jgi:hypothetical protein
VGRLEQAGATGHAATVAGTTLPAVDLNPANTERPDRVPAPADQR